MSYLVFLVICLSWIMYSKVRVSIKKGMSVENEIGTDESEWPPHLRRYNPAVHRRASMLLGPLIAIMFVAYFAKFGFDVAVEGTVAVLISTLVEPAWVFSKASARAHIQRAVRDMLP